MDKDDLKEHMKSIDGGGHKPKNVPPPNENPPDGTYLAKITEARFQEKRDGSTLMFILSFEVLEGDHKQWPFDKWYSKLREFVSDTWIDNKDKLDRLIQDLHVLKCCPDKWTDLAKSANLDAMVGLIVEVELKTVDYKDSKTGQDRSMQFVNLGRLVKAGTTKQDDGVPF